MLQSIPSFVRLALAALLVCLLSSSSSTLAAPARRQDVVPLPQNDPFYQPPAGYASQPNGAVLRSRQVAIGSFGVLPAPVTGYQLLYRTTAINGTAIASVTTVFRPVANAKLDRFINFATAEDSSAPQCAPSYNYRLGAQQNTPVVAVESLEIQSYLLQGYIVNSPDYEGPDSAFSAGRLSGRGVLDSMRAVQNFRSTLGLTTSKPAIAGIGYSGGAIATGWAASLHKSYARELNVKAWAAGGVPANLSAVVDKIDGGFWAGFLPTAIAGLAMPSAYASQANPLIADIAKPAGLAALEYARTHCQGDDLSNFAYKSVKSTDFQKLGDRFLYDSRVKSILSQTLMGAKASERPIVPILIYHSTNDEIIPYAETSKLVDRWCAQGSSVDFITLANGGHVTGEIVAMGDVQDFVTRGFAGTLNQSGCRRTTKLDSLLDPVALGASLEPLAFKLLDILHAVGEGDSKINANPSLYNTPLAL